MANLLLLILALALSLMVTNACKSHSTLEDVIRNKEALLSICNVDDLDIFNDFCPLEGERKHLTDQMSSTIQSREMRIPILKQKQELMFQILEHDERHRELLCQAVLLEHSGRGQANPGTSSSCRQSAKSNVYKVNFDLDQGSVYKMSMMGLGGSQQPPTKPPFQKKKIPDEVITIDDTTDEEEEADEVAEEINLVVPPKRVLTDSSCSSAGSIVVVGALKKKVDFGAMAQYSKDFIEYRQMARVRFPLSTLDDNLQRPRDQMVFKDLDCDEATGLTNVVGLTHNTPIIDNACNIDSFLTHMILLSSMNPDLESKYFVLKESESENTLRKFLKLYWKTRSDQNQGKIAGELKKLWITQTSLPHKFNFQASVKGNRKYDIYGSEYQNIFEPLHQSSLLLELRACKCPTKTNKLKFFEHIRVSNEEDLVPFLQYSSEYERLLQPIGKRCRDCTESKSQEFLYHFVTDTTWFVVFECPNKVYYQIDPFRVPKFLEFPNVLRDGTSRFTLGYISMSTENSAEASARADDTTFHQVSFHRFDTKWYFYDNSLNGGKLRQVSNPNSIIKKHNYAFSSIVYFRM